MKKYFKPLITILITIIIYTVSIFPNININFINLAKAECIGDCGGGCPAGCPGVITYTVGGCFSDNLPSLECTYAGGVGEICEGGTSTSTSCPDSCSPSCDSCVTTCEDSCVTTCETDPYQDVCTTDCSNDCSTSCSGCEENSGCDLGICFDGVDTNSGCIDTNFCTTTNDGLSCFSSNITGICCDDPAAGEPTAPPGGEPTAPPDATPTPGPRTFQGNFFEDPDATTTGLGGTDNLCTGVKTTPIILAQSMPGTEIFATRTSGESQSVLPDTAYYILNTETSNSDYTVAIQLPFPPPDPANAWQCACNADPGDPYRCLYTNQTPSDFLVTDFFFKRANIADAAWFQTLGGSSWAANNIESIIPSTTCTPPSCSPALISSDPAGNSDSAGFPLTESGTVSTSISGDNYIHEATDRTTAVQAQATGVSVPTENYDYFFDKVGDQAETLATAAKPIVGTDLEIYKHTGNLIIDENNPWNLTNTERIIVFIDGDLTIDDTVAGENRITTIATGGNAYLMFISSGDTTITANVGYSNIATDPTTADISNLEGVFVSDGVLTIAGTDSTTDRKFIGSGTFVGWSGIALGRNFDDGASPTLNDDAATETFIFRPDLLINTPKAIKSAQMTWREVEPSF